MASSQETYNKRDQEKKRLKKRLDKQQKLAERKANSPGGGLENMIAYVDENGNITDTPPNPANRTKIDAGSIEIGVPKRENVEVPSIRKGRVEFFNHQKGFGFIKEVDSQEKFFVHVNGLIDEIKENDMVTFELERGFKGMSAVGVKKV
ncbi:MAG: cold shock domain-containing protein [Bacteroidetes bacterium]|nr:cold shock domain-containing protein [Bacteroidota bacterium]